MKRAYLLKSILLIFLSTTHLLAEPVRLVMVGPPGAGKGTQATQLAEHFKIPHISTGAMLRDHISRSTELGLKAKAFVDSGELVPDHIIVGMLEETLRANGDGFILDGFPRTLAQAKILDQMVERLGMPITGVVHIAVPDEVVVERLTGRGRKDDTEAVIRRRLEIFGEETTPILSHYRDQSMLLSVDGVGSIQEVQSRIRTALASHRHGATAVGKGS